MKSDGNPKFVITKEVLSEMAQLAAKSPLDTSHLSWTEVQQVLTLWSLENLFESYGLESPFEISSSLFDAESFHLENLAIRISKAISKKES